MSEDGNWRDALPDDIKAEESLAPFEDVTGLAKSFIETKKMVGNGLRIPGEDANDEQRQKFYDKVLESSPALMLKPNLEDEEAANAFYKSLGRPEDPSKYEPVKVGEFAFDEERETAIRAAAHEAGLSGAQFKGVVSKMLEHDKAALATAEATNMEQMTALKQEWGLAFDDKKAVAEKVRATFFEFIPAEAMDARTIQAMNAIGAQMLEGDAGIGDHRNEGDDDTMTPADARAEIAEIMENKEHPYWNPMHPGNADALLHMVELQTFANPGAQTTLVRAGFSAEG